MKTLRVCLFSLVVLAGLLSCNYGWKYDKLPILGDVKIVGNDTIYHEIPDFSFIDQDSQIVNNATFAGKAYVADFFFIHCPTICPITVSQMWRIYHEFEDEPDLLLLNHTIDTKHDTVAALKKYADNLGVSSKKWHFVTGDHDEIYEIADDYFSSAQVDASAPGGFDHSGRLILVDKDRHVRSFCDGTDPESVDRMIEDIRLLLKEMKEDRLK